MGVRGGLGLGLWKKVRVCQRRSPGGAGGQGRHRNPAPNTLSVNISETFSERPVVTQVGLILAVIAGVRKCVQKRSTLYSSVESPPLASSPAAHTVQNGDAGAQVSK